MISLVACLMLAVAVVFYVFCLPTELFTGSAKTRGEYLRERKEAVYENLRDLNFEYTAGKVPDVDYASLKSFAGRSRRAVGRDRPLGNKFRQDTPTAHRLMHKRLTLQSLKGEHV